MKTCTKCCTTKPVSEFSKAAKSRDGLNYWCRSCAKTAKVAWTVANKDKLKVLNAKWRAKNRDEVNAKNAKRKKENPEAYRIYHHNRRARQRDAGGTLSTGLAERLFKLQRGKCACGCKQPLGKDYHLDHRMPLALGGTNTDDNMQLLRKLCNQQKYAKHPIDFMQSRGFLL